MKQGNAKCGMRMNAYEDYGKTLTCHHLKQVKVLPAYTVSAASCCLLYAQSAECAEKKRHCIDDVLI